MPLIDLNTIRMNYYDDGAGEPVILVMGTGSGARAWHLHQVPALVAAGYRAVTFDNRGIPPTDVCEQGYGIDDLVDDLAALIEHLGIAGCACVGTSNGAYVVQELALARPELVGRMVLMATRGRTDAARAALSRAEIELHELGVRLPARYDAVVRAWQNLSPSTLDDDRAIADWLDLFEFSPPAPGLAAQLRLDPMPDRLDAYRRIRVPAHVIAFEDDLITPPRLGAEVADAVPGATLEIVSAAGHYGYLEQPELVNKSILDFLRR